uniref:RING-type E3 ubiquitin transferase n=1 Tax=Lilium longiflorum TaxID=4690 RepID=Q4VG19_LILLO|nr:pollen ankyrin-like protein [Lilium longiflorum]
MGNSLGCSASGERLVSAARDGDAVEARMLLEFSPCLAKYSTFGGLNSPLHFAAAKGHIEIVEMLLENGADVNSRNYCGQTALMQACRHGHWEVVQTLLLFRSNVTRADYMSGRTALHFAAMDGHTRCIRLLVADFVPSTPYGETTDSPVEGGERARNGGGSPVSPSESKNDQLSLARFINKAAEGGLTALHMAALSGHFDCVQLLLDLHADVSAETYNYSSSMNFIGSGSTPLHYAACGGSLKCCQMLLAKGASRLKMNGNGWLPIDVARIWGWNILEPILDPTSDPNLPTFPPSTYLSLPLKSIVNIARECGLQSSTTNEDNDLCAVCLERACNVAAEGCSHELCVQCALYLCSTSNKTSETAGPPGSIPCPLCRNGIVSFMKLPNTTAKELRPNLSLSFCNPCIFPPRTLNQPAADCKSEFRKNRVTSVSSEAICPLPCAPFPSVSIPSCSCDDDPCQCIESDGDRQEQQPHRRSQSTPTELDRLEEQSLASCSGMFWTRRNCQREHQCNAEINA